MCPEQCLETCEGNALQKNPINIRSVCRLRPVLARFVPGFPGRKRGGCRYRLVPRIRKAGRIFLLSRSAAFGNKSATDDDFRPGHAARWDCSNERGREANTPACMKGF